jgi:hypothetical protein
MTEKNMTKADLFTAVIFIVLGITILTLSLQMPSVTDRGQSVYSAPGVVPSIVGAIIIFLSSILFIRSILRGAKKIELTADSFKRFFREETSKRMVKTILLCIAYAVSLGKVWFPLTTLLFVFLFIMLFEYNFKESVASQKKILLFSGILAGCTAVIVTFVFQYVFLVNLP